MGADPAEQDQIKSMFLDTNPILLAVTIAVSLLDLSSGKVLDDKVKHLQLINAVSSNDLDGVLNAIFKINSAPSPPGATPPSYGSPLHLVTSLCQSNIVENVLNVFCHLDTTGDGGGVSSSSVQAKSLDWINCQNSPERETPLHIASKLARVDVLELLFQIPNVNDTIRDAHGLLAEECAPTELVRDVFERYRSEFINMIMAALRNAVDAGDHNALDALFEKNERAQCYIKQGWIDINGPLESINERSLLHLAAKLDNLELVVWALKYGADPNVSDKKGRKPVELTKAERIKEILKHAKTQAPIISTSLAQANATLIANPTVGHGSSLPIKDPPVLKGILSKWTNYKDGYQPRYLVLEAGVLSYYQDIKDYPAACRGSLSTLSADTSFPDSHDLSRFDVAGSGGVKYSLKARSPADAKKWVWALKESRMWLADSNKVVGSGGAHSRRNSLVGGVRSSELGGDLFQHHIPPQQNQVLLTSNLNLGGSVENLASSFDMLPTQAADLYSFLDSQSANELQNPEMRRFLTLLKTEMQVQKETVETAVGMLNKVAAGQALVSNNDQSDASKISKNALETLPVILNDSGQHIESLILGIVRYCVKREHMWEQKLTRANNAHKRLEDVLKQIAATAPLSDTEMDTENQSSKITVEVPSVNAVSLPVSLMIKKSAAYVTSDDEEDMDDEFYDAQEGSASPGTLLAASPRKLPNPGPESGADEWKLAVPSGANAQKTLVKYCTLPELQESAKGYDAIYPSRQKLPLDPSLPKPSLAVWSFLKNAIGKDLSKVTLPVIFNEPVSMLQRMCEDIEFIELLSLASRVGSKGLSPTQHHPDQPAKFCAERLKLDYSKLENLQGTDASLFRLMFVAAFAMSNYSSTAGRTNKPFNPLLGETFELIQPEKHYRYLSEQVCHHPPVSACHCESPDYSFWTEVYVKSKFWGKSLELHPLGNCHVSLPVYDTTKSSTSPVASEHYSWKKVTTCVNNLILGTLTIEHYGDMVVTNHRTGEQCTITFKPKDPGGWFVASKDPGLGGDIVGTVKDSKGTTRFELNGRWDDYLSATPLAPNSYSTAGSSVDLWRVNKRPASSAVNFNLTAFSMALNQTSPSLSEYLPPTDSRKRPDQRAMENGLWELADTKKEECEVGQRKRRKEIVELFEQTGTPYGPPATGLEFGEKWWSPRWFVRELESDTNEGHWRFTGSYWSMRSQQKWPTYIENIFGLALY